MKHSIILGLFLLVCWLLWSGHFDPFMVGLGAVSVITCVVLAIKMGVSDDEGTPLGLRPSLFSYAIWLLKEIVKANINVTKLILDPALPIRPRLIHVPAPPKTELGRVILANSITLTPGTVSVDLQRDGIWVHALHFEGAEDDLSGDMARRVCNLER